MAKKPLISREAYQKYQEKRASLKPREGWRARQKPQSPSSRSQAEQVENSSRSLDFYLNWGLGLVVLGLLVVTLLAFFV